MLFHYGEALIQTGGGTRRALVITPTANVLLERAHLERLRAGERDLVETDDLVARVRERHEGVQLTILRATNDDGSARYRFDESLSADECDELGYRLLRDELRAYRAMAREGIVLHIRVEFGRTETYALRAAVNRLVDELETKYRDATLPATERRRAEGDAMLLRHAVFFFAVSHERVLQEILPKQLLRLERQMMRMRNLVISPTSRSMRSVRGGPSGALGDALADDPPDDES